MSCHLTDEAALLGLPMPFLLSPVSIVLYSAVHAVMTLTGMGAVLVRCHQSRRLALPMDILFSAIDAVCRSEGIANLGLAQVQRHPNPVVARSWLVQMLAGALLSGGLPLMVDAFQLSSPTGQWHWHTPAWMTDVRQLCMPDLVGGVVVAACLRGLTGGDVEASFPWLPPAAPWLASLLTRARDIDLKKAKNVPFLPLREAKAVGAAALFGILLGAVLVRHSARELQAWRAPRRKAPGRAKGRKASRYTK